VVLSPDPNQRSYISLLQLLYPQAVMSDGGDGRQSLVVSADALADTEGVTLVDSGGSTRPVSRFGEIPPDISLPADLTWRTGVRLPRGASYEFAATAPGGVRLRIDSVPVADQDGSLRVAVHAAAGVHFLELETRVSSARDRVDMTVGGNELTADQTYRLMDAPWGLLARLARPASGYPDTHLDSAVTMAFFDPELGYVAVPNSIVWSGSLVAPESGTYRMAFASEDTMHLVLDSRPVDVVKARPDDWRTLGVGSLVELSAGPHRVQLTLDISHGGRDLARWNWVPPLANGAVDTASPWSVVPPPVLRPDPTVVAVSPGG
jgi:hypothetical protein